MDMSLYGVSTHLASRAKMNGDCTVDDQVLAREALRVETHNERARELALPATLTTEEWIRTLNHFQWACAYCSEPYEVLEHFIPLSLQGETSALNCLPSCLLCNARKHDAHPGMLSWVAPSSLLYIRSYFAAISLGMEITPIEQATIVSSEEISQEDLQDLLTIQQITAKTGKSEKTIRRWISSGRLPARFDKRWLVRPSDLEACTSHITGEWNILQQLAEMQERLSKIESDVLALQKRKKKVQG